MDRWFGFETEGTHRRGGIDPTTVVLGHARGLTVFELGGIIMTMAWLRLAGTLAWKCGNAALQLRAACESGGLSVGARRSAPRGDGDEGTLGFPIHVRPRWLLWLLRRGQIGYVPGIVVAVRGMLSGVMGQYEIS